MTDDAHSITKQFLKELEDEKAAGWEPEVGPDCKRCGAKDCHPIFHGYCSNQCEDMAEDEARIDELETEAEQLRAAIKTHKRRCVIDPQPWDRDLWEVLDE